MFFDRYKGWGTRPIRRIIHASDVPYRERHGSACAECVRPCVVEVNEREHGLELAIIWSSEYGFTVDALELYGEEGRDKLRKAAGRSTYPVIRG